MWQTDGTVPFGNVLSFGTRTTLLAGLVAIALASDAQAANREQEFLLSGRRLFIADADGSNMKLLITDEDYPFQTAPCWSQDGKLISFSVALPAAESEMLRLVVAHADGSHRRILGPGQLSSFSPDATQIAYTGLHGNRWGMWIAKIEDFGGEITEVQRGARYGAWSPDGSKIAYVVDQRGGQNLMTFDLVTAERKVLLDEKNVPFKEIYWCFSWSFDSQRLACKVMDRKRQGGLAIIDARGGQPPLFHPIVTKRLSPSVAWRPNGTEVLFSQIDPRLGRYQVYAFAVAGDRPAMRLPVQLPRYNADIAVSPDGKKLLISSGTR